MDIEMLRDALGEELYTQARGKLSSLEGWRVIDTQSGSWVPRGRFDEERKGLKGLQEKLEALQGEHEELLKTRETEGRAFREQVNALKGDVKTKDEQIASLSGSIQEREKSLEEMKGHLSARDSELARMKESLQEREGQIQTLQVHTAEREAVRKAGARDPEVVFRLLDQSGITRAEDGSLQGLQEQLNGLRRDAPYLFQKEHAPRGGYAQSGNGSGAGEKHTATSDVNAAIRAAFGR